MSTTKESRRHRSIAARVFSLLSDKLFSWDQAQSRTDPKDQPLAAPIVPRRLTRVEAHKIAKQTRLQLIEILDEMACLTPATAP